MYVQKTPYVNEFSFIIAPPARWSNSERDVFHKECGYCVCGVSAVRSPALRQCVVAEVQDELVQRVWLFPDFFFFLLLHFGLRFLDTTTEQFSQHQHHWSTERNLQLIWGWYNINIPNRQRQDVLSAFTVGDACTHGRKKKKVRPWECSDDCHRNTSMYEMNEQVTG